MKHLDVENIVFVHAQQLYHTGLADQGVGSVSVQGIEVGSVSIQDVGVGSVSVQCVGRRSWQCERPECRNWQCDCLDVQKIVPSFQGSGNGRSEYFQRRITGEMFPCSFGCQAETSDILVTAVTDKLIHATLKIS